MRFTDTELAAEAWAAIAREAQYECMGWRTNHSPDWINSQHEAVRQADIVDRFATLPHALDLP